MRHASKFEIDAIYLLDNKTYSTEMKRILKKKHVKSEISRIETQIVFRTKILIRSTCESTIYDVKSNQVS